MDIKTEKLIEERVRIMIAFVFYDRVNQNYTILKISNLLNPS